MAGAVFSHTPLGAPLRDLTKRVRLLFVKIQKSFLKTKRVTAVTLTRIARSIELFRRYLVGAKRTRATFSVALRTLHIASSSI